MNTHGDLIDRYERGEDVTITSLPQPTQDRLIAERARKERQQEAYDAGQAVKATERERELAQRFFAAGGSRQDWEREKAGIMAEDRKRQVLDTNGAGLFDDILRPTLR